MSFEKDKNKSLKWRFDISTFRLIGRDLITDRVTAVFELLKNCYDANSTQVDVIFENVSIGDGATVDNVSLRNNSKITISDNGHGMSFEDIRDKWMVIGTSSKRAIQYSDKPFNRKYVGEKGIGRFAVDKLGDKLKIITKSNQTSEWLTVNIDWAEYYDITKNPDKKEITLFTDIETDYSFSSEVDTKKSHGTTLEITKIREPWTKSDVERLIHEAGKIVSPFIKLTLPFAISITAKEFGIDKQNAKADKVEFSTLNLSISFNDNGQESLYFDKRQRKILTRREPIPIFGGVKMQLFYFNEADKRRYNKTFVSDNDNRIDGIKIYRDGIITTPFAESEFDRDKKRDILGIDKRLWRDLFNRVSSREIIGILDITKTDNPHIIDATNRQDFIDNHEYRELKNFIIKQLTAIEEYKVDSRRLEKSEVVDKLSDAKDEIMELRNVVTSISKDYPALKNQLSPIVSIAQKTSKSLSKALKVQRESEEEFVRKENMYLSIMSLQEYSIHIAHAVRTSLGKIQRKAEFFNEFFPNPTLQEFFIEYSKDIYDEMVIVDKVVEFMLSYSQSNLAFKEVNINLLINKVFYSYNDLLIREKIEFIIDAPDNLIINTQEHFFLDILQNLISNSIKALDGANQKLIKCTISIENKEMTVLFSDTGSGIPKNKRDWVFGIYNTTTEKVGGAGIGLYITRTRVESLQGQIQVIDSEFGKIGSTFKLTFPLKKQ